MYKNIFYILFFIVLSSKAQHNITIKATLDTKTKTILIDQEIVFKNTSNKPLTELYFNDWANSFSSKTTPLGHRFAENYKSSFHFEKDKNRGKTTISAITTQQLDTLEWKRGNEVDILIVKLKKPLLPNESQSLHFNYTVKVASDKFTRYGVTNKDDYKLRYWFISPGVYDEGWKVYSNKNTDDLYLEPSNFSIEFTIPKNYKLFSDFDVVSEKTINEKKITTLRGLQRNKATIYLVKHSTFKTFETDKVNVTTNLRGKKVTMAISALAIDRILHFLDEKLGPYPHKKMLISETDYKKNPVYGLNQLPNFISPFPDGFENNMEQLKTITRYYLENTLSLNPREDYWLIGALQIHLMKEYVNQYYPKMKIIGNLSNLWIIKWAHLSDIEFNDQYPLFYLNMARTNLQQSLTTTKDSLIKFNKNIANDYYAGEGIEYLSDYIGKDMVDNSIKEFYTNNTLKPIKASQFQKYLENKTTLPINWFFENFLNSRKTIDFKIKTVEKKNDSLDVTIINKRNKPLPVSLYGLNNNNIVFKKWTQPIDSSLTVTVQARNIEKLALNYEATIPEFNQRNNFKNLKGFVNKPIQLRLFQDIENPKYNQLFFIPVFQYNLYDGVTLGLKLYNKTLLRKAINYKIEPQFGLRSKKLVGKGSISYRKYFEEGNLYSIKTGFSGSYFSYNKNLFYRKITPFVTIAFRNHDLRNNTKHFINVRDVNVYRDRDPLLDYQEPNYSVFNLQYVYYNPNLINHFRGVFDTQFSSNFSKISTTLEFRKLFINNRQLNLRLFAGAFIRNKTLNNGDFFSFALDKPTDYLFDYTYYGRSENSGLFSQQIIVAEGGFKSKLQPAFANSWITTVNASTNIWKWIHAYGDIGFVHNKGKKTKTVFDTGVRLHLVADYFEVFFPVYSSLGWEPGFKDYDQRIRFIVTLDLKTLLGLFTRTWY